MQEVNRSGRHPRWSILADQRGLSTVEYVIILALIAAVAICSWIVFGRQVRCALGLASDELGTAINAGTASASQACAKGELPCDDDTARCQKGAGVTGEHVAAETQ
jgi:Flp pilus assembly pilin Flp